MLYKVNDEHSKIIQFDTEKFKQTLVLDIQGTYIKAKEVVQNKFGIAFCCPYFDNGTFHLLVFNKFGRICDFNINEAIDLDTASRSIDNF